jgi:Flp pilus assembly protein TadD
MDQVGRALTARGMTRDALAIFALEAELFSKSATAHSALGVAFESVGNRSAASAEFERALAIDPSETRAMEHLRRLRQ